jgi:hypothetical protein
MTFDRTAKAGLCSTWTTSRPGFLHEVLLVGFSLEDAEEAANALNALEIALHADARRVGLLNQN